MTASKRQRLKEARASLDLAKKQLKKAQVDSWEPQEPAECVTSVFYAYENAITAAMIAVGRKRTRKHAEKSVRVHGPRDVQFLDSSPQGLMQLLKSAFDELGPLKSMMIDGENRDGRRICVLYESSVGTATIRAANTHSGDPLHAHVLGVLERVASSREKSAPYDRSGVSTLPLPFFGDVESARVLTVGVNPSAEEFIGRA